MLIVGLHNDVDAGVVLIRDGELLDAVGEERLNRIKQYEGVPELALQYVLDRHGLTLDDIDVFAYGWHQPQGNCREYAEKLSKRVVKAMENDPTCGDIIVDRILVENERDGATRDAFYRWMREIGVSESKIMAMDHHEAHAWSAHAPTPFDEAVIFTFDGRGDQKCATVSIADDRGIRRLDYLTTFDSIGYLYGKITAYLGFKPHRHEGKVTGLAARGNPEATLPVFRSLFGFEDGAIVSNIGAFKPFFSIRSELASRLAPFSREDVAAGVQAITEEVVLAYVSHWLDKIGGGPHNVGLAGGLFGNVRLNQLIAELPQVDNIYVAPNMGDGGIALGGAMCANHALGGGCKVAMPTVLLGNSYSASELLGVLKAHEDRVVWEEPTDRVAATVQDLCDEKVVGWFEGRMEYGPRALGARSILYHARDAAVNDWLNKRMDRTEFMPFAPVTPQEYAEESYMGWRGDHVSARFMTRTYDCSEAFRQVHKAVVHVDGTARPQIVSAELNGAYYQVVKAYCDATGERAVINTSFNRHEEPIVCTPEDALGGLMHGMIDVLYLDGFRVVAK